jgi:hypothetical protein
MDHARVCRSSRHALSRKWLRRSYNILSGKIIALQVTALVHVRNDGLCLIEQHGLPAYEVRKTAYRRLVVIFLQRTAGPYIGSIASFHHTGAIQDEAVSGAAAVHVLHVETKPKAYLVTET